MIKEELSTGAAFCKSSKVSDPVSSVGAGEGTDEGSNVILVGALVEEFGLGALVDFIPVVGAVV